MKEDEFNDWLKKKEPELLEVANENSERGRLARVLLKRRTNQLMEIAAVASAVSAVFSAIAALIALLK